MKKTAKFWNILMFVVMMMLVMVSCGGNNDDSNSGSTPNVVDGPTIWSGKRIVGLNFTVEESPYGTLQPIEIKCEYDSKGRLSKIFGDVTVLEDKFVTKTEEIASIDYDLQTVTILENSYNNERLTFGFSLNKNGYISQVGTCILKYEDNYLTGVEETKFLSTLSYDENSLIKATVSNMTKGNLTLYYLTYGNVDNQGDLVINAIRTDDKGDFLTISPHSIVSFIAYQAGLFGKVSKHFLHFSDKSASSGVLNLERGKESYVVKMNFTCE